MLTLAADLRDRNGAGLIKAVQSWQEPKTPAPRGSSSSLAEQRTDWAAFGEETHAGSFASWLNRMQQTAEFKRASLRLKAGMAEILHRMEQWPDFRATCFTVANEASISCRDRVAIGFNQMQSALLSHQAHQGDLSPEGLMCAAVQLFNHEALTQFVQAHARKNAGTNDEIEVLLALEIGLKDHMDLPPRGVHHMLYPGLAGTKEVKENLRSEAHEYVRQLYGATGANGLLAFLSNQTYSNFSAWTDLLRRESPAQFDDLDERRARQIPSDTDCNSADYLADFNRLTADHARGIADCVAVSSYEWLQRQMQSPVKRTEASSRAIQAFDAAMRPAFERKRAHDFALQEALKELDNRAETLHANIELERLVKWLPMTLGGSHDGDASSGMDTHRPPSSPVTPPGPGL